MSDTEVATETNAQENAPAWYLDESTPGAGERPEWLPKKYNKVSDLGRSYSELEKKLGSFTGAPDEYDLSSLEIDTEQFVVKQLTSVLKEQNMNQEGVQKVLGALMSATETENAMHLDEQMKALGKDGERELTAFKNYTRDHFKAEESEVVSQWIKTADDLKTFNRIMAHSTMSTVPTNHTMAMANNFETVTELKAELAKNIDRFDKDRSYQKDWSSRLEKAVARNPNS